MKYRIYLKWSHINNDWFPCVQKKVLFFWVDIKQFNTGDPEYDNILAEELLEKLEE